ncbi:MAG: ABC transporter permease [Bacteroides sp.]|nr:ABC transporter permease [Bacteroides sp.]MCM1379812.1 ABC transporter permease [Bacteroides sp.]MCM1446171.1 ABC transporter permease [Prevotella sp.]
MIDLLNEIWQNLSNNKGRTTLTGIAVAWGIFMLIVLLGMSNGVVNSFKENRRSQGSNMLKVWGGITSMPCQGYQEGRTIELKEGDIARVAHDNPTQAAEVAGQIDGQAVTISTPHDYTSASYSGVYPSEQRQRALEMKSGRFINDVDLREQRKVVVISTKTAETLFADPATAVGSSIRVGDLAFRCVGVYDTDWNETIYIPFTTARILAGSGDIISSLNIELQNVSTEADGTEAEESTRRSLAANHTFRPDDESAVDIWNRFNQQLQMSSGMNILNYAVWVIGLFTLLSGIIGVSNIMFVSVRERTHEIGVRRAIGAKPRSILTQIICESVAITTIFGYIGIVFGTAVNEVIARITEHMDFVSNPRTDIGIALSVTVVLIVAGMLAGLFPALKALKVKPVEALREE